MGKVKALYMDAQENPNASPDVGKAVHIKSRDL